MLQPRNPIESFQADTDLNIWFSDPLLVPACAQECKMCKLCRPHKRHRKLRSFKSESLFEPLSCSASLTDRLVLFSDFHYLVQCLIDIRVSHNTPFFELSYVLLTSHAIGLEEATVSPKMVIFKQGRQGPPRVANGRQGFPRSKGDPKYHL